MKKAISLVLAALLVLSLTGCAGEGQALYEKYAPIIDMLEAKDYQGAIRDITAMAIEEQRGDVEEVPILQVLCATSWYTGREDIPQEMTFREDGSCTIGGETMTWLAQESWSDEHLELQISKDGKISRYVSISTSGVVPSMYLSYAEERDDGIYTGEGIGNYYNHPLMPQLLRSWYQLTEYETVEGVEGFSLSTGSASVSGDSCNWTLADATSPDLLVAHIDAKNEREGSYTVTMTLRDGFPVATVTDDATGDSGLYYNGSSSGYSKTWPEYIYAEAKENLAEYLENGSFWCGITETSYSDRDETALAYLYDQFLSVGDYADAAQILENWDDIKFNRVMRLLNTYRRDNGFTIGDTYYNPNQAALEYLYSQFAELEAYPEAAAMLDRFTVVEDKLLEVNYTTTNNMGNVSSENTQESYEYNALGQVTVYYHDGKLANKYGTSYRQYLTYDDAGKVISVSWGSVESPSARVTPVYDEHGNRISDQVMTNNGEYAITYTYDDQNRLVEIRRPHSVTEDADDYYYTWTCVYDDSGNLVQEIYQNVWNAYLDVKITYDYQYDGSGNLIGETEHYESFNWNGTLYRQYTNTGECVCDDQGRVVQMDTAYGKYIYADGREANQNYASRVTTYTYGNVYFFDDAGMDPAE